MSRRRLVSRIFLGSAAAASAASLPYTSPSATDQRLSEPRYDGQKLQKQPFSRLKVWLSLLSVSKENDRTTVADCVSADRVLLSELWRKKDNMALAGLLRTTSPLGVIEVLSAATDLSDLQLLFNEDPSLIVHPVVSQFFFVHPGATSNLLKLYGAVSSSLRMESLLRLLYWKLHGGHSLDDLYLEYKALHNSSPIASPTDSIRRDSSRASLLYLMSELILTATDKPVMKEPEISMDDFPPSASGLFNHHSGGSYEVHEVLDVDEAVGEDSAVFFLDELLTNSCDDQIKIHSDSSTARTAFADAIMHLLENNIPDLEIVTPDMVNLIYRKLKSKSQRKKFLVIFETKGIRLPVEVVLSEIKESLDSLILPGDSVSLNAINPRASSSFLEDNVVLFDDSMVSEWMASREVPGGTVSSSDPESLMWVICNYAVNFCEETLKVKDFDLFKEHSENSSKNNLVAIVEGWEPFIWTTDSSGQEELSSLNDSNNHGQSSGHIIPSLDITGQSSGSLANAGNFMGELSSYELLRRLEVLSDLLATEIQNSQIHQSTERLLRANVSTQEDFPLGAPSAVNPHTTVAHIPSSPDDSPPLNKNLEPAPSDVTYLNQLTGYWTSSSEWLMKGYRKNISSWRAGSLIKTSDTTTTDTPTTGSAQNPSPPDHATITLQPDLHAHPLSSSVKHYQSALLLCSYVFPLIANIEEEAALRVCANIAALSGITGIPLPKSAYHLMPACSASTRRAPTHGKETQVDSPLGDGVHGHEPDSSIKSSSSKTGEERSFDVEKNRLMENIRRSKIRSAGVLRDGLCPQGCQPNSTLSTPLSQDSDSTSSIVQPLVVVLVHGLRGDIDTWHYEDYGEVWPPNSFVDRHVNGHLTGNGQMSGLSGSDEGGTGGSRSMGVKGSSNRHESVHPSKYSISELLSFSFDAPLWDLFEPQTIYTFNSNKRIQVFADRLIEVLNASSPPIRHQVSSSRPPTVTSGSSTGPPTSAINSTQTTTSINTPRYLFICHSMGGLIVKSALLRDLDLRDRTAGVVFFGTPHVGSPIADYAVTLLVHEHVAELSGKDKNLIKLNEDWLKLHVPSLSFYETATTDVGSGIKLMVVPQESACAAGGECLPAGTSLDHHRCCKIKKGEEFKDDRVIAINHFIQETIRTL